MERILGNCVVSCILMWVVIIFISFIFITNKENKCLLWRLITVSAFAAVGLFYGYYLGVWLAGGYDMVILLVLIMPVLIFWFVITIYNPEKTRERLSQKRYIIFIVISIIALIVALVISANMSYKYTKNYKDNIETKIETVVKKEIDRQLLYFCNIPVQNVSGKVEGDFNLGYGNVSGNISTSDKLSYWYLNDKNKGIYDTAPAKKTEIVFISEEEKPYLKIITYSKREKTIDHNTGKGYYIVIKEWKKYVFYLPETVMQYELN